jgi:hypothetical protein
MIKLINPSPVKSSVVASPETSATDPKLAIIVPRFTIAGAIRAAYPEALIAPSLIIDASVLF